MAAVVRGPGDELGGAVPAVAQPHCPGDVSTTGKLGAATDSRSPPPRAGRTRERGRRMTIVPKRLSDRLMVVSRADYVFVRDENPLLLNDERVISVTTNDARAAGVRTTDQLADTWIRALEKAFAETVSQPSGEDQAPS